ncbi:MAG: type II toxin-antitoxin system ParD family antitoxin [Sedimentisphaerales bacterium]|nr:type II toxin-antitoxin system ParD family antitoxin [Sedimentisphaerales bacterium]MBN2842123.1 type II toxin-antitoxin system ParD family antitoxin [Sedimentisphaerales bacterium]
MNVSLTKELENFVEDKVNSGMYSTASEVIREGLRLLKMQELKLEIQKGLDQVAQGKVAQLDVDKIKATGRQQLKKKKGD